MKYFGYILLFFVVEVFSNPVSEPVYTNQQYVGGENVPFIYRQVVQPQYSGIEGRAHPVSEQNEAQQPQQYVQRPAQPLVQPLLGNVDRQVQKAAHHLAGPFYAHQIQNLQLQGQAAQAQAQIERNALRLATAPRAQPLQYQQPNSLPQGGHQPEIPQEYNSNPSYQFGFDVKDDLYTNYHNRKEQREGDKITGSYSVVDSDGFIRTVTYTADPKQGFKAEVTRQPTDIVVKIPQPQQQPEPQIVRQPQYVEVGPQGAQQTPSHQPVLNQGRDPRIVYQYQ